MIMLTASSTPILTLAAVGGPDGRLSISAAYEDRGLGSPGHAARPAHRHEGPCLAACRPGRCGVRLDGLAPLLPDRPGDPPLSPVDVPGHPRDRLVGSGAGGRDQPVHSGRGARRVCLAGARSA